MALTQPAMHLREEFATLQFGDVGFGRTISDGTKGIEGGKAQVSSAFRQFKMCTNASTDRIPSNGKRIVGGDLRFVLGGDLGEAIGVREDKDSVRGKVIDECGRLAKFL